MSQNYGHHHTLNIDVDGEARIVVDQERKVENGMERVIRIYDELGATITTLSVTCSASIVEVD